MPLFEKAAQKTKDGAENISEELNPLYEAQLEAFTVDLLRFCGLVGRVHATINRLEDSSYFPGPTTVISTGYRKVFRSDALSANFAFSNAYIAAEKFLKGNSLYVDNNILQLLSVNTFSRNILRYSLFVKSEIHFDPELDYEDILHIPDEVRLGDKHIVELFHKKYLFRTISAKTFCLFQILDFLYPYLKGELEPKHSGLMLSIFKAIKIPKTFSEIKTNPTINFWGAIFVDLFSDIRWIRDSLVNNESEFYRKMVEEAKARTLETILLKAPE
jgi:hypothetical protein